MSQEYLILPSKRRIDIHGISPPFDQLLQNGEVITGGTCVVEVLTGEDPDPSHMLEGSTSVVGTNLYQQIKLGLPGVIYVLKFTAVTDFGNSYTVEAKQAVLENAIPAGPIYQYDFLTSPPYPIESIEGISAAFSNPDSLLWRPPMDGVDVLFTPQDGTIRDLLITYVWPPEDAIDIAFTPQDGTIRDILLSYTMRPEGVDVAFTPQNGTLKDVLITYSNYPPEGILATFTPRNGTLT